MTHQELLNKTFIYLYENQIERANIRDLTIILEGIDETRVNGLLKTLADKHFAKGIINKTPSSSSYTSYDYWIDTDGILFIEKLPKEFKDSPYTYYLEYEAAKESVKEEREKIDYRLKQVTLKSISYHKNIALGSIIVAMLAIVTPIVINKMNGNNTTKTETTLPQLPTLMQNIQQEQKVLQDILDSLRKK